MPLRRRCRNQTLYGVAGVGSTGFVVSFADGGASFDGFELCFHVFDNTDLSFVQFFHLQFDKVVSKAVEKIILHAILIALVVDSRPRIFVAMVVKIAKWLLSSHPAYNDLLFFGRQIVQSYAVGADTPHKARNIHFS